MLDFPVNMLRSRAALTTSLVRCSLRSPAGRLALGVALRGRRPLFARAGSTSALKRPEAARERAGGTHGCTRAGSVHLYDRRAPVAMAAACSFVAQPCTDSPAQLPPPSSAPPPPPPPPPDSDDGPHSPLDAITERTCRPQRGPRKVIDR